MIKLEVPAARSNAFPHAADFVSQTRTGATVDGQIAGEAFPGADVACRPLEEQAHSAEVALDDPFHGPGVIRRYFVVLVAGDRGVHGKVHDRRDRAALLVVDAEHDHFPVDRSVRVVAGDDTSIFEALSAIDTEVAGAFSPTDLGGAYALFGAQRGLSNP